MKTRTVCLLAAALSLTACQTGDVMDEDASALEKAIHANDAQAVEQALKAGEDPNKFITVQSRGFNRGRRTDVAPLRWAASLGNPRMVQALLAHGASVHDRGNALCMAAWQGSPVIVKALLDAGAQPNPPGKCFAGRPDAERVSPVVRAQKAGNGQAAEIIAAAGGKAEY